MSPSNSASGSQEQGSDKRAWHCVKMKHTNRTSGAPRLHHSRVVRIGSCVESRTCSQRRDLWFWHKKGQARGLPGPSLPPHQHEVRRAAALPPSDPFRQRSASRTGTKASAKVLAFSESLSCLPGHIAVEPAKPCGALGSARASTSRSRE